MKKVVILVLSMSLFIGCGALNKQQKGTIAGSAGGALLGAAASKGSIWGILAGAAIGGVAGNLIGKNMDEQAKALNQAVPSAEVNRVGEGINMTFDSSLAFKLNSSELSSSYKSDLAAAAQVFKSYPDTHILIEGHTDDSGAAAYNLSLSFSASVLYLVLRRIPLFQLPRRTRPLGSSRGLRGTSSPRSLALL